MLHLQFVQLILQSVVSTCQVVLYCLRHIYGSGMQAHWRTGLGKQAGTKRNNANANITPVAL